MYKVHERDAQIISATIAEYAPEGLQGRLMCATDHEALGAWMRRLVGDDPVLGRIVGEHLDSGGKRLRARLALASADALGVPRDMALPWAAAVELLHNATLIHDDVQDGDRVRRGHPTVWARHGVAQAINAGDLLLMLPYRLVGHVPVADERRWLLCRLLAEAAESTVRGQALEFALADWAEPSAENYREVCAGKTGALFALPVAGAAILAGESWEASDELASTFREAGIFFQMQDDVLDLYGDKGRERRGCDLYEGKISALVVAHLELHPDEAPALLGLLRTPRSATTAHEVQQWVHRFAEAGALERVLGWMRESRFRISTGCGATRHRDVKRLAEEFLLLFEQPISHVVRSDADAQWSVA